MNILGKLAIIFCGVIVAGAFLNLYILGASLVLAPLLKLVGLDAKQVFSVLYWTCFVAGAITAFFVMRPAWRAVGKRAGIPAKSDDGSKALPTQDSR